jgi:hypothetical protein
MADAWRWRLALPALAGVACPPGGELDVQVSVDRALGSKRVNVNCST